MWPDQHLAHSSGSRLDFLYFVLNAQELSQFTYYYIIRKKSHVYDVCWKRFKTAVS
jgi:hypothetical protein